MKSRPLAGGRAPRAWLRRIARAVAPLQGPRRASAWLGALAGVHPRLRDEPLFGRALGELARRDSPAGEPAREARRAAKPRSAPPTAGEARRPRPAEKGNPPDRMDRTNPIDRTDPTDPRSEASPPVASSGHPPSGVGAGLVPAREGDRTALEPLRLDPRAGRDLLARHAGEVPAVSARGEAPAVSGKAQAPTPLPRSSGSARPAAPSPDASAPRARREWLRGLARRGARALRRDFLAAGKEESPPAEPWSAPLPQGEQAPADLLRQWAAPARKAVPAPPARHPERPSPPREPSPVRPRPEASTADSNLPSAVPPPLPGPGGAVPVPTADDEGVSPSRLLDAALPPLLPSRDTGPSSPWRAPAQVPAAVGRHEAEAAEEDLSRLAANLKRILDDEARRHGIDV